MSKPQFVYVTVIAATPEAVWKALTTAEFTRQYWYATRVESDFAAGSSIRFLTDDDDVALEGTILVADAPHTLSYTFTFPRHPAAATEPPSRVTFTIEAIAQGSKLTVVHDDFEPQSEIYTMVAEGWPFVLAGLKTLLELQKPVDFTRSLQGEAR